MIRKASAGLGPGPSEEGQRHRPGGDGQARETGGVAADLGPSGAAPDAHEQHQVPGDVGGEREDRQPGGGAAGEQRQGEDRGEQGDDAPAEDAPEPEGATERDLAAPEPDDGRSACPSSRSAPRAARPPASGTRLP